MAMKSEETIIRDGVEMVSELSNEKLTDTYYIHIRSSDVAQHYAGGIGTLTSVDLSGKIPINYNQYILASVNSAEIPYSFYNISTSRRNNAFNFIIEEEVDNPTPPPDPEGEGNPPEWEPKINHTKLNKTFVLTQGNYNVISLIHALEQELSYTFTSSYIPPPPEPPEGDEDEDEDEEDPEEPPEEPPEEEPFVPTEVHISVSISFSLITGKLTFSTTLPTENVGVITLTITPLGLSGNIVGLPDGAITFNSATLSHTSSNPISLSPNTLFVLSNLQNINTFSTRDKNVSNIFAKVPIVCNPYEMIHHNNSYNASGIRLPTGSSINSLTLQIVDEDFIPIDFNSFSYDLTIKLKVFSLLK